MNFATDPWGMWLVGFIIGLLVASVASYVFVKAGAPKVRAAIKTGGKIAPALIVALALVVLFAPVTATLAQTPVPITIDTNEIFTQTNNWIQQFTPIQAIGIGATLALAILSFLAATLTGAFKGSR